MKLIVSKKRATQILISSTVMIVIAFVAEFMTLSNAYGLVGNKDCTRSAADTTQCPINRDQTLSHVFLAIICVSIVVAIIMGILLIAHETIGKKSASQ